MSVLCLCFTERPWAQTNFTSPVVSIVTGTATSYTATAVNPLGQFAATTPGTSNTYSYGTQNKQLTSFSIGGNAYGRQNASIPSQVIFRRNNASGVTSYPGSGATPYSDQQTPPWGDRQTFYVEGSYANGTYNMVGSYPGTVGSATNLEESSAFVLGYANVGIDNAFVNQEATSQGGAPFNNSGQADATANNVERIDVIWNGPITVTSANIINSGIMIANRGQNDDAIKVAAIKSLTGGSNTGGGTNYIYGDVLEFNNAWTRKGINGGALSGSYTPTPILRNMTSVVLRREDLAGTIDNQLPASYQPASYR